MISELSFSFPQLLSIIGLTQCVFIIVHIANRMKSLQGALIPLSYFFFLAVAFFLDFGYIELNSVLKYYEIAQWLFWFYGPPLSVILILQLVYTDKIISKRYFMILSLPLIAWLLAFFLSRQQEGCDLWYDCETFLDWLYLFGVVAGGISLLAIWLNRNLIQDMHNKKFGKDRYWLILALMALNIGLLVMMLVGFEADFNTMENMMVRNILGLAFIYLTTTSLFRVYPTALELNSQGSKGGTNLNTAEKALAQKIESLMTLDKVYQEPSYSRSDLAREMEITEGALSRIINMHYRKSFPQLMNEYRLEDAKRLLSQTDATIKIIATEVGFNSLASFNRVFKTEIGITPTQFREKYSL